MRKRRWFQFRLRTLLLGLTLGILLGALVFFAPRVRWRFGRESHTFRDIQCIPVESMSVAEMPKSWVRCRFGSVEFALPPRLAEGIQTREHVKDLIMLQNGTRTVLVFFPERTDGLEDFLKGETTFAELQELSIPELRLAAYQASWDDFRWTMSPYEFRLHRYLVALASLTCSRSFEKVETFACGEIEGLLALSGEMAGLEWYTRDGRVWGRMNFIDRTGNGDFSWVRPVCQSVTFCNERFLDQTREGEPTTSFRVLQGE